MLERCIILIEHDAILFCFPNEKHRCYSMFRPSVNIFPSKFKTIGNVKVGMILSPRSQQPTNYHAVGLWQHWNTAPVIEMPDCIVSADQDCWHTDIISLSCWLLTELVIRPIWGVLASPSPTPSQPQTCIKYSVPDAVPIHAESYHVATDNDPSKFRSIFSDNLQLIATRGKKARGTLLVDIGCSSKRAPLSVSYYNEISGGHIGSCHCSEEGLCRPSTTPVYLTAFCFVTRDVE